MSDDFDMVLSQLFGGPKKPTTRIGFWWSPDEPELPHPQDFVDESWDEGEREKVARYLDSGRVINHWRGYSWCRICGAGRKSMLTEMGSTDLGDDTYLWPQGLSHYVRLHKVKPPQEFIDHVLSAYSKAEKLGGEIKGHVHAGGGFFGAMETAANRPRGK